MSEATDAERLGLVQALRDNGIVAEWRLRKLAADALESAIVEKRARDKRIDELEARASDWLNRANENYDKLKAEKQAAEKERDIVLAEREGDYAAFKKLGQDNSALSIKLSRLLEQNRVLREALPQAIEALEAIADDYIGNGHLAKNVLPSLREALRAATSQPKTEDSSK